jgi:hypothetical protein
MLGSPQSAVQYKFRLDERPIPKKGKMIEGKMMEGEWMWY